MTANPLRGPNPPELGGPRFLDLSGENDVGGRGEGAASVGDDKTSDKRTHARVGLYQY